MHRGRYFLPSVVISRISEFTVCCSKWCYKEIFPPEFTAHCEVLPQCPASSFCVMSDRRGMMANLKDKKCFRTGETNEACVGSSPLAESTNHKQAENHLENLRTVWKLRTISPYVFFLTTMKFTSISTISSWEYGIPISFLQQIGKPATNFAKICRAFKGIYSCYEHHNVGKSWKCPATAAAAVCFIALILNVSDGPLKSCIHVVHKCRLAVGSAEILLHFRQSHNFCDCENIINTQYKVEKFKSACYNQTNKCKQLKNVQFRLATTRKSILLWILKKSPRCAEEIIVVNTAELMTLTVV